MSAERMGSYVDQELGTRYKKIADIGTEMFANTPLSVNYTRLPFTPDTVELVQHFLHHPQVSPARSFWRLSKRTEFGPHELVDGSMYGNWNEPGGPMEHINLTMQAAEIIAPLFGQGPHKLAAVAGLHDVGRLLTHGFYEGGLIGKALLRRMGIAHEVIEIMPDESVMLTPQEQDIQVVINAMPEYAITLRIVDELGKRFPGTNRLYHKSDYSSWNRQAWLDGYKDTNKRPLTRRPSDEWWREEKGQLHINNVPRYFDALDNWVKRRTNNAHSLDTISTLLNERLGPSLRPLPS